MVVDDMSVSRQLLMQMLEAIGITHVRSARSVDDACRSLARQPADLIIADLDMPGRDGLDLLRWLRADRRHCRAGFVLASGHDADPRIEDAWACGMNRFLAKPFEIKRFIKCLEAVSGRV